MTSFLQILEPMNFIQTLGFIGILVAVFAESGLFFGFFLPGDSLLFTAGILASQNLLPTWPLFIGVTIMAILGDSVGYIFGKKMGPKIFSREDSRFFHKKHIERAQSFYKIHGPKTIILARFVPIVRTFAPIVAGVGTMHFRNFLFYNIVGGIVWAFGLIGAGYWLGGIVPNIDHYLLPIILCIILLSLLPLLREFLKARKNRV